MKRSLFLVFVVTILTMLGSYAYAEESINVTINDEPIIFDAQPIMKNDRILVPIRKIAEKMLFEVTWEEETQEITLENYNTILKMYIGKYYIRKELKFADEYFPDKISSLDSYAEPAVYNDRTYISLRAVSELFGAEVNWNEATNTAEIFYANTYGEEVTFEDKSIEYLTKLELLLEGLPLTDHENGGGIHSYNSEILNEDIDLSLIDELYPYKIREGTLRKITRLGEFYLNDIFVYSIEDIKKFPNLENLTLYSQKIKDITPLTFKKNWKTIYICGNMYFDFKPLKDIRIRNYSYFLGNYSFLYFCYDNHAKSITQEEEEKYLEFVNTLDKIFTSVRDVIKENITDDMTNKEKLTAINNWICDNINYDYSLDYYNSHIQDFYFKDDFHTQFEAATLFHHAQCSGYSNLFAFFCEILEIPNLRIHGTAYGTTDGVNVEWGPHSWNLVLLEDGKLYYIDTCWNGPTNNNYLFLSSEELKEIGTHKWNEEEIKEDINDLYNEL